MTLFGKLKIKTEKAKIQRTKFIGDVKNTSPEFQIATWFGSGLIVPASGTWGTVGGAIFAIILMATTSSLITFLVACFLTLIGYWATKKIESQSTKHDSSFIVIDEVVAILFVYALMPQFSVTFVILGFIIFRIFDAAKPWPINWLDHNIGGAAGVIIDDLMAALYTLSLLWGIYGLI